MLQYGLRGAFKRNVSESDETFASDSLIGWGRPLYSENMMPLFTATVARLNPVDSRRWCRYSRCKQSAIAGILSAVTMFWGPEAI